MGGIMRDVSGESGRLRAPLHEVNHRNHPGMLLAFIRLVGSRGTRRQLRRGGGNQDAGVKTVVGVGDTILSCHLVERT